MTIPEINPPVVNIPGLPAVPKKPVFESVEDALWFIFTNPCGANPWIMAITAFNPLVNALIELIWVDVTDAIGWYFGPPGPKGVPKRPGKYTRGKGRGGRGKKPGLNEHWGKKLDQWSGRDDVKGTKWTNGKLFLWGFYGILQRALFYWALISVGEEFFINWASLLYKQSRDFHKCPRGVTQKGDGAACHPLFGWVNAWADEETYRLLFPIFANWWVELPPGRWLVTFAQTKETFFIGLNPDVEMEIGIAADATFQTFYARSGPVVGRAGDNISTACSAVVEGGRPVFMAERCNLNATWPFGDGTIVTITELPYVGADGGLGG